MPEDIEKGLVDYLVVASIKKAAKPMGISINQTRFSCSAVQGEVHERSVGVTSGTTHPALPFPKMGFVWLSVQVLNVRLPGKGEMISLCR